MRGSNDAVQLWKLNTGASNCIAIFWFQNVNRFQCFWKWMNQEYALTNDDRKLVFMEMICHDDITQAQTFDIDRPTSKHMRGNKLWNVVTQILNIFVT